MEDLEEVRQRIRNKKYKKEPVLSEKMFTRFYRFAIMSMSVFVVVLMVSCFIKTHPNTDVMALVDEHILSLLPIPFLEEDKAVSQNIGYTKVEENYYMGSDENIYALEDGLVQSVSDDEFSVLYQNGIEAIYQNLANINIQVYDHVTKGEILANYEQKFYMKLLKNDQEVTYEEIFA